MNPEQYFQRLTDFLSRYDGLELLCQASMTYLFSAEGTFHSESDDIQIWGRRLEFAAGYYATREENSSGGLPVTGHILEEFKTLIDDYYLSIDIDGISRVRDGSIEAFSVEGARIHSMHVRGDAYPHQLEEYARELYGEHDEWFLEKLGFTIADAYKVANGMKSALDDRYNRLLKSTRAKAEAIVQDDRSWIEAGMSEIDAKRSAQCHLFFGCAKEHYRFSLEDIIECSSLPLERCTAVLARLSQKPPFQNPLFPNTFQKC